jgi:hypothetical protein
LYAGQKSPRSATIPICYKPGSVVPVNTGTTSASGVGAETGNGPTTCYELSYSYEPATTTWQPSLASACTLESVDGPLPEQKKEADKDDDWFRDRDKDRSFDDLIIGSITIGVGGPTVGGTGIVGGTGNTAGGTTVGFGGATAGGTTVGGFGNTANNSGTTITGAYDAAAAAADDAAAVGSSPSLPECRPAVISSTTPTTFEQTLTSEQTSTEYDRGWRDGWAARDRQDGGDVGSSEADGPTDLGSVSEPVL